MIRPPKYTAIQRVQKALDAIENENLKQEQGYDESPVLKKWHRNTEIAIANTFEEDSRHVRDFAGINYGHPYSLASDKEKKHAYISGLNSTIPILQSMIEEIEEYWEDNSLTRVSTSAKKISPEHLRDVFIIHGRDDGTKETVARFIERLGLKPIILHEEPNQGQTIIEKFEQHAEVAFAIALLTPDDTGGLAEEEPSHKPRARQNVIFELGYFTGKLGRQGVCALTKGPVEIPSDYYGVLYIPFEESGVWKMALVRELKTARFEVDANLAF